MKVAELTMYQACLLHSRADRTLRTMVSKHLENFQITRMEWLLLATIYEQYPKSLGMSAMAAALDVSLPQITALVAGLLHGGFVKQEAGQQDRRMRSAVLTEKGRALITTIEASMRDALKQWLADIPRPQLEAYMQTVHYLAISRTSAAKI